MADDEVALRGFDMAMPGIGDQLHFRQPLLSFCNRSTLYVARRVDWRGDKRALAIVDDPDDLEMATLFADGVERHVASGEGVVVAGAAFFQAASRIGFQLDGFSHLSAGDCECWIRVATPAEFVALEGELVGKSQAVFDEETGEGQTPEQPLDGTRQRGDAHSAQMWAAWPRRSGATPASGCEAES